MTKGTMMTEGTRWLKVQEGYSKNISKFKVSKERICQSQDSDLKVVESEEVNQRFTFLTTFQDVQLQVKIILSLHLTKYFDNWLDERLTKLKKKIHK